MDLTSHRMLTPPTLAVRVIRRIGRIKGFERAASLAHDRLEDVLFRADLPSRRVGREALAGASTIKEHFDFSNVFFGPHQIESEICGLLNWAAESKPKTVCEIGTAAGGTTYLLGQSLPTVERLIGIDLYVRRKHRLRYYAHSNRSMAFFDGSSYAPETVERVRQHLGGTKIDLLFIDGDHSFDGVARDFSLYRHFVRDGGIIVFHDIVEDYMTRYGRNTGRYTGGVPRFWRQIKTAYQTREFVESPDQDGLGIGAIVYESSVTPPTST